MTESELKQVRHDRRMREARNVLIKRLKADHKYICHKPKNGMEEPDYETPAKTTTKDRLSALQVLAHRSSFKTHTVGHGEFMCAVCNLAAHVSYMACQRIIRGERLPVCTDCIEDEQIAYEEALNVSGN